MNDWRAIFQQILSVNISHSQQCTAGLIKQTIVFKGLTTLNGMLIFSEAAHVLRISVLLNSWIDDRRN